MDKLAEQLKRDAESIDASVSDELDYRIDASLRALTPEVRDDVQPPARPQLFWWASSLTGIAAAAAVILIVNSQWQVEGPVAPAVANQMTVPTIDWKTESAMLTSPLRKELEDLQSDLKKAEEKVKQDIGL